MAPKTSPGFAITKNTENSLDLKTKPNSLNTPQNDNRILPVQFESNQFQFGKPTGTDPNTAKTPRIPSFINPAKPSIQADNKSNEWVEPNQFEPTLPKQRNEKNRAAANFIPSASSFLNTKNSPSIIMVREPDNLANMPSVEEQVKEVKNYRTQTGDTYWSVSEKNYQDGRYFRALYRHNQSTHPDYKLVSGLDLKIPAKHELERLWPDECPIESKSRTIAGTENLAKTANYHITSQGETLFEIARQRLNQASRFVELYELNQDILNEDVQSDSQLPVGLKLLLPR